LAAGRIGRNDSSWQLRIPALTSALAVPFLVLFLILPAWIAPVMYFGACFLGSCMIGPVLAIPQSLAKIRMRALAASLVALTFNVVGTGFGPLVVGVLSDRLAPTLGTESIRYALLGPAPIAMLGAALCFHLGARHVKAELEHTQRAQ